MSYIFRKHISGVLTLINFTPPEQEEGKPIEENIEGGGKALEAGCKRSLNAKPDDALVANVKLLCSPKGFKTIKELIDKQGESGLLLINPNNSEDLSKKYEAIKQLDYGTKDETKVRNMVDANALKAWCSKYENEEFYKEGTFSSVYPKFRFRCLKSTKAEG